LPEHPLPGHALVTSRAVAELVQRAALSSYGVVGFSAGGPIRRLRGWLGRATPGVRVRIAPSLHVELALRVAFGVPIAQVASNVESAVRYAVRHSLGREVDSLVIHVDGLQIRPATRGTSGSGASGE
jgi:uncharacterized alkaline shock family protein YloU